jgi:TonB family protein
MKARCLLVVPVVLMSIGAVDQPIRQPTERWVVNFDDAQCLAQRNYGTAESPLLLIVKQPPLGDVIQLAVIQKRNAGTPVQYEGSLTFDGGKPLKMSVLQFEPKSADVRTYLFNLSVQDFMPATTAKTLAVRAPGLKERFGLSGVGALMKVMDDCVTDLRKVWNIAPKGTEISDSSKTPVGDLRGLFSYMDYPADAVSRSQSGTVSVILLVNEQGRVADCTIIGSSAAAALDGQSCAILRDRAKFKPATDVNGKPAKGAFQQRITWRMQ